MPGNRKLARFGQGKLPKTAVQCYGLAVAITVLCLLVRLGMEPVTPGRPYYMMYVAVLLSAYFCGTGPAIAVMFSSTVLGAYWQGLHNNLPGDNVIALTFLGTCAAIIYVIQLMHDAIAERDAKAQQLYIVNREMVHRLSNIIAVVSAICKNTIQSDLTPNEMSAVLTSRLQALARTYHLIGQNSHSGATVRELINAVVEPVVPASQRIELAGPEATLPPQQVTTFALALHELATNALKHGAWHVDVGIVRVSWEMVDTKIIFWWREDTGDLVNAVAYKDGVGMRLIKRIYNDVRISVAETGAECRLTIDT